MRNKFKYSVPCADVFQFQTGPLMINVASPLKYGDEELPGVNPGWTEEFDI